MGRSTPRFARLYAVFSFYLQNPFSCMIFRIFGWIGIFLNIFHTPFRVIIDHLRLSMCVASFCIRHHYPNQELQKSSSGHHHPVCWKEAMSVIPQTNQVWVWMSSNLRMRILVFLKWKQNLRKILRNRFNLVWWLPHSSSKNNYLFLNNLIWTREKMEISEFRVFVGRGDDAWEKLSTLLLEVALICVVPVTHNLHTIIFIWLIEIRSEPIWFEMSWARIEQKAFSHCLPFLMVQ